MASNDESSPLPQSSLKIEEILQMAGRPQLIEKAPAERSPPAPKWTARYYPAKVRETVTEFLDKQQDNGFVNVFGDILMVVFGLGATAAILALVIWIIRLLAGTG